VRKLIEGYLVYPSGSMLEMSNGYPSSPLGPSPSPSPGLIGHHSSSKHHLVHSKQHSPSNRSTNLRVVIPSTPSSSNINSDDMSYGEVSHLTYSLLSNAKFLMNFQPTRQQQQQQTSLNTPVVALQTPLVPGLNSYPVSSFGAQDFSMSSSDLNMISWSQSHQNLSATMQHNK
jgi:hypothetical protein